ncbi:MAG: DUF3800 domain-containing protein [Terriglobales bacterium]
MLIAYLDEAGHETKDMVIVAGFLGSENQWELCGSVWRRGLGRHRALHMKRLKWAEEENEIRTLLARLGPIPHECGLTALLGAAKVSDYQDLVDGNPAQKLLKGYYISLVAILDAALKNIPKDERLRLVSEQQDQYAFRAGLIFNSYKHARTTSDQSKLAEIAFVPKDACALTQPADYLAYALLQLYRDPKSKKSQLCEPILRNTRPAFGNIVYGEKARTLVRNTVEKNRKLLEVMGHLL